MIFGNEIFRDMVSTPAMRQIFSGKAMVQSWLDVEAALARAQAACGVIPESAAARIADNARLENLDFDLLIRDSEATNHPIVALLRQLAKLCGPAGAYVHWGATSQDIIDTGAVLQLRNACALLRTALVDLVRVLTDLASEHRATLMVGRTHGQHALPLTFGFKVAVWLAEVTRHVTRFDSARECVLIGQFAGGVGTLAGYGPRGRAVQRQACALLGLGCPDIGWHTARDGLAEFACMAAMLGATIAKIGNELATLQRTEVAEVLEPFPEGFVGSSTMPHKRNPVISEGIVASCTLLRDMVPTFIDAMIHEHERDSSAWNLEWMRLPEIPSILASVLERMRFVLSGLEVDTGRMAYNLDALGGMVLSEAVMLHLGRSIGRDQAHELVYDIAMEAHRGGHSFRDMIIADDRVSAVLSPDELARAFDATGYTGHAIAYVDDIVARSRDWLRSSGGGS